MQLYYEQKVRGGKKKNMEPHLAEIRPDSKISRGRPVQGRLV